MMIGNPVHVPLVHEVFSPTAEELAYWQRPRPAGRRGRRRGSGPVVYGDANQGEAHVVHIAHVGSARKNLAWARELGVI